MAIIYWIGIDDHADKWTIAAFRGTEDKPHRQFELVPNESGYRKLIAFFRSLDGEVRVVYEAGPCGYELYRRLGKSGIDCKVAAPSLTPKKPGDRVKTNRRDAVKLARYLRSGDLTIIVVPDPERESLRDLVRARQTTKADLQSVGNQITKLLLRYGHRFRDGSPWTQKFWRWLRAIELAPFTQAVLDEMIVTYERRRERLASYDEMIEEAARKPEYAAYVGQLCTLRGVATLTAMTILAELGDLRRFGSAGQLMAAIGLVPSEFSTGDSVVKFGITKTGNAHVRHVLIEAAWQYKGRVIPGPVIRKRRKGQDPAVVAIAEKCDARLHKKFSRMIGRGKLSTVAAVAVARELAGFLWAVGQIAHP